MTELEQALRQNEILTAQLAWLVERVQISNGQVNLPCYKQSAKDRYRSLKELREIVTPKLKELMMTSQAAFDRDLSDFNLYLRDRVEVVIREEDDQFIVCPKSRPSFWLNHSSKRDACVNWCNQMSLPIAVQ